MFKKKTFNVEVFYEETSINIKTTAAGHKSAAVKAVNYLSGQETSKEMIEAPVCLCQDGSWEIYPDLRRIDKISIVELR